MQKGVNGFTIGEHLSPTPHQQFLIKFICKIGEKTPQHHAGCGCENGADLTVALRRPQGCSSQLVRGEFGLRPEDMMQR